MRPRNNILVVIAALIVSVRTSPPPIGRGSFSYDPNSIVQNERILRLFLRLASYTANRLIYLKNEAKQREKSRHGADANSAPQLRIGLPQKAPEEKIANSGYNSQSGGLRYDYRRDPRTATYGEPSRNRYDFNNKYPERVNSAYVSTTEHMLSNEYPNGKNRSPYIVVRRVNDRETPNNPTNNAKKPVDIIENRLFNAEKNNYVTNTYNDNSRNTNNTDGRMKNTALPHQPGKPASVFQSDALIVNPNAGSLGLNGSKRESNVNRANPVANQSSSRPPNGPPNLPSLLKSGDQSGQRGPEIARQTTMSTASNLRSEMNGATSAVQSKDAMRAQSPNTGAIARRTAIAASNFQLAPTGAQNSIAEASTARKTMTATSNHQFRSTEWSHTVEGVALNRQSTGGGIAREAMTPVSNLQSSPRRVQNSISGATVTQQTMTAPSNSQSVPRGAQNSIGEAMVVKQTMPATLNRQSESTGLTNSIQRMGSNGQRAGSGIAGEIMTTATNVPSVSRETQNSIAGASVAQKTMTAASNLQFEPTALSSTVQAGASNGQSSAEAMTHKAITATTNVQSAPREAQNSFGGAAVAQKTMTAASNLQFGSMKLTNSIQRTGSNGQSSAGGGIADLAATVGSNMQSSPLEKLSSAQDAASKISTKTMTAGNKNQATQRAAGTSSGILNSDKSEGILRNAKPPSLMTKQGPSLANLSETISVIRNIGSGPLDSTTKVTKNGDKKSFQENQNPAMSAAWGSTGPANRVVGGLAAVGSKYIEPLVLKRGEKTKKPPTGTRYRQGNAASTIMGSGGNGVTEVGSKLINTLSFFRSFPDIEDQSRSLRTSGTDVKKDMKDVPNGVVKNSDVDDLTIGDGYGKYEDRGVSEVELQEYANQFANALRPIAAMS